MLRKLHQNLLSRIAVRDAGAVISAIVVVVFCSVTTAMAGDGSNGSANTGSIAISAASLNDGNSIAAAGSFTTSMKRFNFQADGVAAKYNANDIWHFGLHAFWRNPDTALLGVVGSTTDVSATKTYRYGIEGEYYLNSLTFAATVGRQNGGARRSEWAGVDIRWYPFDDLMLAVGGSAISDERAGRLGFEWQAPFESAASVSLFGGVSAGKHGYSYVGAGIRIYFGGKRQVT